jgi:beta-glucuronidase
VLKPSPLIQNVSGRSIHSLDGTWRAIVDPYENGYYNYRHELQKDEGYFANRKPSSRSDRVEYDFDTAGTLEVPGDWNSQRRELFFYEGTVWYKADFDADVARDRRLFLYFGAANYEAKVYVNGRKVGEHEGGFTPFDVELAGLTGRAGLTAAVRPKGNFVVVKVDDRRRVEGVPSTSTDWWNYGGLTRDVWLVDVPGTFIRDYVVQLAADATGETAAARHLSGWVQLDGPHAEQHVAVRIAETGTTVHVNTDARGFARFDASAPVDLWSPEHPRLYAVDIVSDTDRVSDRIGFRRVATRGSDMLLNGAPVFLRGISLHEQAPLREGRAYSVEDAQTLLGWARELGANFVRLAHYPHNEHIVRLADEMGLMVWSEIPVYWTLQWDDPATLANATGQLAEMIARDKNRASVVLWSVGNETPRDRDQGGGGGGTGDRTPRLNFLNGLIDLAHTLDPSRPVTAALEARKTPDGQHVIDDPLGARLDVIGCNEYVGWYDGLPDSADTASWRTAFDKPLIVSEFGADALQGLHGDALTRWTEEYQASVYEHQLRMLAGLPSLRGMTPWVLADFRSPRRPLAGIQDYWNRKGLISERGEKKAAFYVLQRYYEGLARSGGP